jgi:uncharacterized membrane protein HdeD (DUF308 family)
MSTAMQQPFDAFGLPLLKKNWGWILGIGILQIAIGSLALGMAAFTTIASVMFFGWLLLAGGLLAIVHGFRQKQWSGFFLDLAMGALYAVAGVMVIGHPVEAALNLTLVIALFLMAGGVLRIVAAFAGVLQHRWWVLLNGVITLVLGVMIWRQWPLSGLWVIGLFVGIDLIVYGWSLVMLGLSARQLPGTPQSQA